MVFRIYLDETPYYHNGTGYQSWRDYAPPSGGLADFTFNVGGRFVISYFYIGLDYVFESYYFNSAVAVEIGAKMSF